MADCQQSITALQQKNKDFEGHIAHLNGLLASKDNERESIAKQLGGGLRIEGLGLGGGGRRGSCGDGCSLLIVEKFSPANLQTGWK